MTTYIAFLTPDFPLVKRLWDSIHGLDLDLEITQCASPLEVHDQYNHVIIDVRFSTDLSGEAAKLTGISPQATISMMGNTFQQDEVEKLLNYQFVDAQSTTITLANFLKNQTKG